MAEFTEYLVDLGFRRSRVGSNDMLVQALQLEEARSSYADFQTPSLPITHGRH
jgi:hypothetical protein